MLTIAYHSVSFFDLTFLGKGAVSGGFHNFPDQSLRSIALRIVDHDHREVARAGGFEIPEDACEDREEENGQNEDQQGRDAIPQHGMELATEHRADHSRSPFPVRCKKTSWSEGDSTWRPSTSIP